MSKSVAKSLERNGSPAKGDANDIRSMYGAQTAADSGPLRDEQRQSFGKIGEKKPERVRSTDFTVAEDLHRRVTTTTPEENVLNSVSFNNSRPQQSEVFAVSPRFNGAPRIQSVSSPPAALHP